MYFDLFLPFPVPEQDAPKKKGKDKGKQKALAPKGDEIKSCWQGLDASERDAFARDVALAGHLGYSVAGCTVIVEPSVTALPSPFRATIPFPHLDPRQTAPGQAEAGPSSSIRKGGPVLVQVTRFHMRIDDAKHCFTNSNSAVLKDYDILSVQPTTEKAFQVACSELANPGPNQISIITLPLHERPYHFRLHRKQIKQALRNGVMFEILYSPGLFPSPSTNPDAARRYRQNFIANAREVVRVTEGKGIILSSGPGASAEGKRGALDVVNLGTMLGLPANAAKDAVSGNPKRALLNAQARRTYKAIFSEVKLVPPPGGAQADTIPSVAGDLAGNGKRAIDERDEGAVKKLKVAV